MKILKVYDDTHTAVKVQSALTGRTTTNIASALLNHTLKQIEEGELKISDLTESDEDGVNSTEAKA